MILQGVHSFYKFSGDEKTVYIFGELHKPSECGPGAIPIEQFVEARLNADPSLYVLLEGNASSSSIHPSRQSGVYETIKRLQAHPRVLLVDIRPTAIPNYALFELVRSIVQYMYENKYEKARKKEAATFTAYGLDPDTFPVKQTLVRLNALRDTYAKVMDDHVAQLIQSLQGNILYIAGTYHVGQTKDFLSRSGYQKDFSVFTHPQQDCLSLHPNLFTP